MKTNPSTRRTKSSSTARKTRASVEATQKELQRKSASPASKPGRRRRTRPLATDKTIILAMSPVAANILRALLGKARYDSPELDAIRNELDEQCK